VADHAVAPAVRSSRISAPLVSVSGVFESEIVRTKQPIARGDVALCSSGTLSGRGVLTCSSEMDGAVLHRHR
jgi:hypothetical protein